MKYFDKDGNEITDELFTKEDVDKKISESTKESESKVTDLESKNAELQTQVDGFDDEKKKMKEAHSQQIDRLKDGKKPSEREDELQKQIDELKGNMSASQKEAVDTAFEKKLDELSKGDPKLREMIEIKAKEMKDISSLEDVDSVLGNSLAVVSASDEGKQLLDNIVSGNRNGEAGEGEDKKEVSSPESRKLMGVSEEAYEKYKDQV